MYKFYFAGLFLFNSRAFLRMNFRHQPVCRSEIFPDRILPGMGGGIAAVFWA
jgi:hypothetical protein